MYIQPDSKSCDRGSKKYKPAKGLNDDKVCSSDLGRYNHLMQLTLKE